MTERDDYLSDPALPPDPEIEALERALAPLRWHDQAWRERPSVPPPVASPRRRWPWFLAAAAAALAIVAVAIWRGGPDPKALHPEAAPRSFVAADKALAIPLGVLAEITLRPGSEVRFEHWRPDQALFSLVRGGLSARVEPPPAVLPEFFVIGTNLGRVVDQGCRYELDLLTNGDARVRVTEGAVTFEAKDREVFVPVGASLLVTPGGPFTPCFDDAPAELRKALEQYDALTLKRAPDERLDGAVKQLLESTNEKRDTLVLWHLLRDERPVVRELAEKRLFDLVDPPVKNSRQESFPPEEWLSWLRLHAWQPGG